MWPRVKKLPVLPCYGALEIVGVIIIIIIIIITYPLTWL